jgi:dTDP-4-amino-4,6-dideoxygalactose transaminase
MQRLLDGGIATRRGIMLSHLEPAYAGCPLSQPLGHSERASARSILLPLFPQITDAEHHNVLVEIERVTQG